MKLFQIEEPDGSPVDPDAPGVAVGIDLTGPQAVVAVSIGGNAVVLQDSEGLEIDLAVPAPAAAPAAWQTLFEGVRVRAERALAQPVTHVVLLLRAAPEPAFAASLMTAGGLAGLEVLRFATLDETNSAEPPAMAAAVIAEDLAPRPAPP